MLPMQVSHALLPPNRWTQGTSDVALCARARLEEDRDLGGFLQASAFSLGRGVTNAAGWHTSSTTCEMAQIKCGLRVLCSCYPQNYLWESSGPQPNTFPKSVKLSVFFHDKRHAALQDKIYGHGAVFRMTVTQEEQGSMLFDLQVTLIQWPL